MFGKKSLPQDSCHYRVSATNKKKLYTQHNNIFPLS